MGAAPFASEDRLDVRGLEKMRGLPGAVMTAFGRLVSRDMQQRHTAVAAPSDRRGDLDESVGLGRSVAGHENAPRESEATRGLAGEQQRGGEGVGGGGGDTA